MNRRDFLKTSGTAAPAWDWPLLAVPASLPANWPKGRRTPRNSAGDSGARPTASIGSPSSMPSTRRRPWGCTTSRPTPASGSARTLLGGHGRRHDGGRSQGGSEETGRFRRQNGQLRRRRLRPEAFRIRQGDGHRNARRRAERGTISTQSTSSARSSASIWPSTTIRSLRTTGTPTRC